MNKTIWVVVILCTMCLAIPQVLLAGKGYMGGKGNVVVEEEPPDDAGGDGDMPSDIEGPLNDKMADAGKLYGDLFVILRQTGAWDDQKLVPQVNEDGSPAMTAVDNEEFKGYFANGEYQAFEPVQNFDLNAIIGGEPVLTVNDPPPLETDYTETNFADYGWYAAEVVDDDGNINYKVALSPFPAQCVQPVASYERWGDISEKTSLTKNRLPLVITYDPTWDRSECAVGQLIENPTVNGDGTLDIYDENGELGGDNVNIYFIKPGESWGMPVHRDPATGDLIVEDVTYENGILWTELIEEVHFGRLNLGRSPEAVLQAAFDEAINNLNSKDTIAIEIDPAGRLLLTKNVADPLLVDPATGEPQLIGTVKKAIDSPLENLALYVKLMQDGHLVTPGDEREPIDRSKYGGIPLWKMLELEDGPSDALRPTIDIEKMRDWGLGNLVDVAKETYFTYYACFSDEEGSDPTDCSSDEVVSRDLVAVLKEVCTMKNEDDDNDPSTPEVPLYSCDGHDFKESESFTGITTMPVDEYGDSISEPYLADFDFAAAFLAAAADKTGDITQDMVVYLNSILGINKVVGYSEYDAEGNPISNAIDYAEEPDYFNFNGVTGYNRVATFREPSRGQVKVEGGGGSASTYDGYISVLWGGQETGIWSETPMPILDRRLPWDYVVWGLNDAQEVENKLGVDNILGFTQQSADDLSIIKFIHTYQIPGLR